MGDSSDIAALDRFMRSPEGREELEKTKEMLVGRRIVEVTFENHTFCISTLLHLDDNTSFIVFQPSFHLDQIRCYFDETLQREYFVDFPERRPEED